MKRYLAAITLLLTVSATDLHAVRPFVVVLGIAQDAGIPQMGCDSPFCRRARNVPSLRQRVTSLGIIDPDSGGRWIVDATPDLPSQFETLKTLTRDRANRLDGIFLTHAHIGHYTGLMYLGRESMGAHGVKVYAMPRMRQMLETNAPWSQLIQLKNIELHELAENRSIRVNERVAIEAFLVPHRDEFSETVGYRIRSARKTVVFIPDIDKWEKWSTSIAQLVHQSDILLLDGTFYADGEINRPMSEVPHPFVSETMALLKSLTARERAKVHFIHFNHSNPVVQGNTAARRKVRLRGFGVAVDGMRFTL